MSTSPNAMAEKLAKTEEEKLKQATDTQRKENLGGASAPRDLTQPQGAVPESIDDLLASLGPLATASPLNLRGPTPGAGTNKGEDKSLEDELDLLLSSNPPGDSSNNAENRKDKKELDLSTNKGLAASLSSSVPVITPPAAIRGGMDLFSSPPAASGSLSHLPPPLQPSTPTPASHQSHREPQESPSASLPSLTSAALNTTTTGISSSAPVGVAPPPPPPPPPTRSAKPAAVNEEAEQPEVLSTGPYFEEAEQAEDPYQPPEGSAEEPVAGFEEFSAAPSAADEEQPEDLDQAAGQGDEPPPFIDPLQGGSDIHTPPPPQLMPRSSRDGDTSGLPAVQRGEGENIKRQSNGQPPQKELISAVSMQPPKGANPSASGAGSQSGSTTATRATGRVFPVKYNEQAINRHSHQSNSLAVVSPVFSFSVQHQHFPLTLIAQLLALHACVNQTELGKKIVIAIIKQKVRYVLSKEAMVTPPTEDYVKKIEAEIRKEITHEFKKPIDASHKQLANELIEFAIQQYIATPPNSNALIALAAKMGEVRLKIQSSTYDVNVLFIQGLSILCAPNPAERDSLVNHIFNSDNWTQIQGDINERQVKLIDDYLIEKFYSIFYMYANTAELRTEKNSSIVQNTFRYILRDIFRLAQKSTVEIATEIDRLKGQHKNNSATIIDLLINIIRRHTVKAGVFPAFYKEGEIGEALKEVLSLVQKIYPQNVQPLTLNELLVRRPVIVHAPIAPPTAATALETLRTNILRITDACSDNTLGREVIDDIAASEGEKIAYITPNANHIAALRRLAAFAVQTAFDPKPADQLIKDLYQKTLETVKELRPTSLFGTKNDPLANTLAKLAGVNAESLIDNPKYASAHQFDPDKLLPRGIVLDNLTAEEAAHYLHLHIYQYAGQLAADYKTWVHEHKKDDVIKEKFLKRIENRLEAGYRMTPAEYDIQLAEVKSKIIDRIGEIIRKYIAVIGQLKSKNIDSSIIFKITNEMETIGQFQKRVEGQGVNFRDILLDNLVGDMHPRFEINSGLRHGIFGSFIIKLQEYLTGNASVNYSLTGQFPALGAVANTQQRSALNPKLDKLFKMARLISLINWYCDTELGRKIAEQNGVAPNFNPRREIKECLMLLAGELVKAYLSNDINAEVKKPVIMCTAGIMRVKPTGNLEIQLVNMLGTIGDTGASQLPTNTDKKKSSVEIVTHDQAALIQRRVFGANSDNKESDNNSQAPDHSPIERISNNIDTLTPPLCEDIMMSHIIGQIDRYLSLFNIQVFGEPSRLQEYMAYRVQKKIGELQKPAIGEGQDHAYQGPQLTMQVFNWLRTLLPVAGVLPELCQKAAMAQLLDAVHTKVNPGAHAELNVRAQSFESRLIRGSAVVSNPAGEVKEDPRNTKLMILKNLFSVIHYMLNTPEGKNVADAAPIQYNTDFRWKEYVEKLALFAAKKYNTLTVANGVIRDIDVVKELLDEINRVAELVHDTRGGKMAVFAHTLKGIVNHYRPPSVANWASHSLQNVVHYDLNTEYAQNYIEQRIIQGAIAAISIFGNDKQAMFGSAVQMTEFHRKAIRDIEKEWHRIFNLSLANRQAEIRNLSGEEKNLRELLWRPLEKLHLTIMGENSILYAGSAVRALNAAKDYLDNIKPEKPPAHRPIASSIAEARVARGSTASNPPAQAPTSEPAPTPASDGSFRRP